MNQRVEILVSVYRPDWGFLKNQINSLFSQESISVNISIRDDTEDEKHLHKLTKFLKSTFPGKEFTVISGDNLGPAMSFLELCYRSDMKSDYFAFCDQDDYWDSGKLKRAINCMSSTNSGLYASTLDVSDHDLCTKYRSKKPKIISFDNSLTENVVTGCTAVFDREIMTLIRMCRPNYVSMHDHWLYMIATAFSTVHFDEQSFIKYRQHGGNVVGAKGGCYYANKLALFLRDLFKEKPRTSDQVKSFYSCYSNRLDVSTKERCERYLGLKNSFIKRIASFNAFSRNGFIENAIFRIKFIIGAY